MDTTRLEKLFWCGVWAQRGPSSELAASLSTNAPPHPSGRWMVGFTTLQCSSERGECISTC